MLWVMRPESKEKIFDLLIIGSLVVSTEVVHLAELSDLVVSQILQVLNRLVLQNWVLEHRDKFA